MHRRRSIRLAAAIVGLVIAATSSGGVAARGGSPAAADPAAGSAASGRPLAATASREVAHKRGPVDVARLAAVQKHVVRPQVTIPTLGRGDGASGAPSTGTSAPLVYSGPQPSQATTNADAPAGGTGFAGLTSASNAFTNIEPPDPWVAVGPEHIVQTVNLSMRITDRQGVPSIPDVAIPEFFGLPTNFPTFDSDPRVIYDSVHSRWFATEVSWDCERSGTANFGNGYIDFAVSRNADPTGVWDTYFFRYEDQLPDYPAPGTSNDKVGLAANLYDMAAGADCVAGATFDTAHWVVMDWAALIAGSPNGLADNIDGFTPRFAVQVPATSSRLHLIYQTAGLGVGYKSVIGHVSTGSLAYENQSDLTSANVVAPFVDPPFPNQPGPDVVTTAIDSRPTDAIWQNNRLVFTSSHGCTPTGDSSTRSCVRVTELNTAGVRATVHPTRTQDFLIVENGEDSYMGGIGLSGNGTLHVGWTRSSTTAGEFPSSYSAHQKLGDTLGSVSAKELLGAGTGAYSGNRWGDYVGVAQDPQVPNQVWDGNQYSGGDDWLTRITPLQTQGTTYVPISPVRVLDTRSNTGVLGKFVTDTARTWQVTGIGGIPADAVAVTGNVTVTQQEGSGFVAVTPTATNTPPSSSINFPIGDGRANNVTVPLSASGTLSALYKTAISGKKTHLIFDVTGYFLADDTGATFSPLTPVRVLDTRNGRGLTGPFVNGTPRTLAIAGVPSTGVPRTATAITGNLTVTEQSGAGYLAVTRTPTTNPATSTLNFPIGDTRANGLFAPLDGTGAVSIFYKSGTTGAHAQVILDVTGYFEPGTAGLRFVPLDPGRVMDTRMSPGGLSGLTGVFHSKVARVLPVDGHWGVPDGAAAVVANLTVVNQTASGYIAVSPTAPPPTPPTSTLNFPLGDTRANGLVTPLNGSGTTYLVYITATTGKATNVILDLAGYFE